MISIDLFGNKVVIDLLFKSLKLEPTIAKRVTCNTIRWRARKKSKIILSNSKPSCLLQSLDETIPVNTYKFNSLNGDSVFNSFCCLNDIQWEI